MGHQFEGLFSEPPSTAMDFYTNTPIVKMRGTIPAWEIRSFFAAGIFRCLFLDTSIIHVTVKYNPLAINAPVYVAILDTH